MKIIKLREPACLAQLGDHYICNPQVPSIL